MKNKLIAAGVGAVLLFIWQFISWGAVDFHASAQAYTEKQDTILNFLNSVGLKEGGYLMPKLPRTATSEEWKAFTKAAEGKPWVSLQYHEHMETGMALNMATGFVVNMITLFLLCWILTRLAAPRFSTIFIATLFTGLIVFFNAPYTHFIWYKDFDIWAHFADAVGSWGLIGLWLGWYLTRKPKAVKMEN